MAKSYMAQYEQLGFGLYLVQLKGDATPIGMCGLIKRDGLDDVDIGFAFCVSFAAWDTRSKRPQRPSTTPATH